MDVEFDINFKKRKYLVIFPCPTDSYFVQTDIDRFRILQLRKFATLN